MQARTTVNKSRPLAEIFNPQFPDDSDFAEQFHDRKFPWDHGLLSRSEEFWRDHYSFLKSRGYLLRYRYSPDWIPVPPSGPKFLLDQDVDKHPGLGSVFDVDATRISDGALVFIKKCEWKQVNLTRKYGSEPLASDLQNHCIPLIETILVPESPEVELVVMPYCDHWKKNPFQTVGQAVDFFSQICEVSCQLHTKAPLPRTHLTGMYIFLDPGNILVNASPDPESRSGVQQPVRYYLGDFEFIGTQLPCDARSRMLVEDPQAFVPECRSKDALYDPFAIDVFRVAWMMSEILDGGRRKNPDIRGFDFMRGLLADMMNDDPTKRPKMNEVVERLDHIQSGLWWWKSRARFAAADESFVMRFRSDVAHWAGQIIQMVKGTLAISTSL
ncbi:hypothetical protein FB45DRAFT_744247 [Roridomyces roridus]|uniref:Protein kinase domain-containing protein n=1 Tax=Roridomyces roridus TaxID=1738132 RepID=A0AAD7C0B1_9AGAR|nr:hypothetical protein FB45DRAFT_744247 [Roridomyces roridus]